MRKIHGAATNGAATFSKEKKKITYNNLIFFICLPLKKIGTPSNKYIYIYLYICSTFKQKKKKSPKKNFELKSEEKKICNRASPRPTQGKKAQHQP